MISKNQIKQIAALSQKKFRDETGLFIAEGTKLVLDLITAFENMALFATSDWEKEYGKTTKADIQIISNEELSRISNQKSPQGVLAIFKKKDETFTENDIINNLSLALDDVQDPGNLGTIIRIADWFGIAHIFCSPHCADAYNPKTVQATMGALSRVKIHYLDLNSLLTEYNSKTAIYGTFMNGKDIYSESLTKNGIIVMGNEGNGIAPETEKLVNNKLLIPNFPKGVATSESLNVGVATALICAEFRRRI